MNDCSCQKCVGACHSQPGWFAPGEVEKAAEFMELPIHDFINIFLIKDHCSNPNVDNAPYVWTPRKIDIDNLGQEIRDSYSQRKEGSCVFLVKDKCGIHPVKPYECRKTMCCDFKYGVRDEIEKLYIAAGAPLGMRPETYEY